MKNCRKCGAELVVGENWYASLAKRSNHICIPCDNIKSRQHYQEHRGEHSTYTRQRRAANPGPHRGYEQRRRARKRGATIGPVDEAAIYERDQVCIYCGSAEDLTLDHIVPLIAGGAHCEDNLVAACRSCNSSKQATTLEEWLQVRPRALAWVA